MKLCYAVPNGGQRNAVVAKKMKAEGVEAGMPDINLDWASEREDVDYWGNSIMVDDCYGLRIEMKFNKNKLTPQQKEKKALLVESGFEYVVCYSAVESIRVMFEYLSFKVSDYQGIKEFLG